MLPLSHWLNPHMDGLKTQIHIQGMLNIRQILQGLLPDHKHIHNEL